jgi:hypothetical protein
MVMKQYDEGWVCPECGLKRGADGYDPCIGYLPGVDYACCGHGGRRHDGGIGGYIKFKDGKIIRWSKLTQTPFGNGTL